MNKAQRAAEQIDSLIQTTWRVAYQDGCSDRVLVLSNHLEFVLEDYTRNNFDSLPETTLWLAKEVIDSAREMAFRTN